MNVVFLLVISFIVETPSLLLDEGDSGQICVGLVDGVKERAVELIATTQDGTATG